MRIAVLGGGHGAYAAAADLAEQGHEVRLWRRDAAAFAPLLESGSIRLKDVKGTRSIRLALATTDIGAALRGAALVLAPVPATAQADIAHAMAPHLEREQVVFCPPGTFGSYAMAVITGRDASFAETGTLPYLARKHAPDEIAITMRAKRLPVGVFPAQRTASALAVIAAAYPAVHPVEDALSAALMNAGPIIHPPLILMNAGPLEHFERWDIHNEGTQPSIRRVTDALDEERIALREALGYAPYHYPLRDHYTSERWMYGDAHDRLTGSGDWREHIDLRSHRYMREDVTYGLAFLVSVARWAGVAAPVASGLLAIASAALGEDLYGISPRTLEALKLSKLDRVAMKELLSEGLNA
ncbi:MAG: glycerol-3-phosphate dehydrogenase [Acidobacteria bacterium RIFCSPLOWO2_02_FULL_59_13]|nr:MAG: glycerol-3-phosphate dehydrogenase [Acidobacteria bacterium RIFCSPLOWO2_02_FULL_59_13]OGA71887.1 MAG: glycerol-3-phosphate dehydrogenase [Betaproteobacteria bacterium RIFCSPLOWO2_12_FULL_65_14]